MSSIHSAGGRYRWFAAGDLNAFFALMIDNMINLVVLSGILVGAFGFPRDVILYKMIPGTALGVLIGDVVYTVLAMRLARKTGRQDITAMPLGLDTPSTIGVALAVLGPSFVAIKGDLIAAGALEADAVLSAAEGTWAIGMAALLMMGAVKVVFSFAGEWVRRRVPQAGLLGSIGGIGLALLCFLPLVDLFRAPVVGLVSLGLVLYTLVARIKLPFNLPGAAVGVLVGTVLYYLLGPLDLLGGEHFVVPTAELTLAFPWPTTAGFAALAEALPYLPIALPFGVLTIVGGINVTESARAAGDDYATRDILLTEAVATLAAGLCGGVVQSTPYIGHPAYKKMGARAGYTLATGVFVGLGGMLGFVPFIVEAVPAAAVMPLLVFIGTEIAVQSLVATPARHMPAVLFAFLPSLAALLLIRQDALLGRLGGELARVAADLGVAPAALHGAVQRAAAGLHADVYMMLGHGFIITAMLWGALLALLIDRRLAAAAFYAALAGVMTLCGFIHSAAPAGDLYWPWAAPSYLPLHWAAGYFALAMLMLLLAPNAGSESGAP